MLQEKLKWLMFFRIAVATILLLTGVVIQLRKSGTFLNDVTTTFYILAAVVFSLSIVYIPLVRRAKRLARVAGSQAFIDIIIITFVVYISGGTSSPLSFLYILTIMSSAIVSYRKGGFRAASIISIFYGTLANLEYYDILPSMSEIVTGVAQQASANLLYSTAANIAAFYLVAFLSGYLAGQAKIAEDELREKSIDYEALEALNNDIVKNISSGLMTIDKNMIITSFNSAAEAITGQTLEEVYGRNILTLFPFFNERLSEGKYPEARWEGWFKRGDEMEHFLGFSISPLRNAGGKESGEIIIFQDLTKLKEMESMLKKADRLAAVGKFAAGVAHEVRNPLASISGSIEILKNRLSETGKGENKKLMDIVIREIDWLNSLITEFLKYAKPTELNKTEFDLNELISETLQVFNNSADTKEKGVIIKSGLGRIPHISADKGQIKQILWNLIKNAADAVGEGGTIDIKTCRHTGGNGSPAGVSVSVSDNGCGIPDNMMDEIFTPFQTSKKKGTGLGLPIVHNIVEAHNGELNVESAPGKKTTFTVTIPAG